MDQLLVAFNSLEKIQEEEEISLLHIENIEDLSNVCRTCAAVSESFVPIFDGEGLHHNLADKILQYLSIKVSECDELPRALCVPCADALVKWHSHVQRCARADRLLQDRLTQLHQPPTPLTQSEQTKEEVNGQHTEDEEHSDWRDSPTTERGLIDNLYRALVRLERHVAVEHCPRTERCRYPDFTDDSDSDGTSRPPHEEPTPLREPRQRFDATDAVRREADGRVYYACGECGKRLSSRHTYIAHRRIHTGERPCVCHVCGKQFRASAGLRRHLVETHERRRRLACNLCHKSFANSQNLRQHARIHTGERPYECTICDKRFTQSGSLAVHVRTHSATAPTHRCAECGAQFRLRAGLARHRLRHSGDRPHACTLCPRTFRQRHELVAHAAVHSGTRSHVCALCAAAFRHRRALVHHCKRAHPHDLSCAAAGTCEYCGRARPSPRHLLSVHADRLFHCDECNTYVDRTDLIRHMSSHAVQYAAGPPPAPDVASAPRSDFSDRSDTDDGFGPLPDSVFEAIEDSQDGASPSQPHSPPLPTTMPADVKHRNRQVKKKRTCAVCTKTFTAASSYFYHVKHVHTDGESKRYECGVCGRRFGTRAYLADHTTVHTGERRFACDRCGKLFRTRASLHIHAQTHADRRPWKCTRCPRTFTCRQKLARHEVRHAAERAHACAACGRRFAMRYDLQRHERTHAAPQRHACVRCGAVYAQLRYLRVHCNKKHPADPGALPPVATRATMSMPHR